MAKALRNKSHLRNYRAKQFNADKVGGLLKRLSDLAGVAPPRLDRLPSMTAFDAVLRVSPPEL
jgi:hypothetical protein